MGEHSHIGWTESSWNPWMGCTKISPGCKFCYMYREMERYGRDPFTVQRSKTTFNAPLKWKEARMVFTCSWSDFFIEAADAWRDEAWEIIKRTPHLTYQILTKRPELILDRLPKDWGEGYANVWLGVSAESQKYADERIPQLLNVPAAVRWVSAEPLLEPLSFRWAKWDKLEPHPRRVKQLPDVHRDGRTYAGCIDHLDGLRMLDWIVVGGESGSDRTCEVRWITEIVDQCREANIAIFVKQDSGPKSGQQGRIPDSHWVHEFPERRNAYYPEGVK